MKVDIMPRQLFQFFYLTTLFCLFIALPSITNNNLMFGTQVSKTFVFVYFVLFLFLIKCLLAVTAKNSLRVNINVLDIGLIGCFLYVVSKEFVICDYSNNKLRFVELIGISLLYLFLRCKLVHYYNSILLFALVLGGIVQGIYGNLQLWGILSSNHTLFKLTGSFFNPGPYAGFLSSAFVVAFGILLMKPKIPPQLTFFNGFGKIIALAAIVVLLLVLPASRSRAAWLSVLISSAFLLYVRYLPFKQGRRLLDSHLKRIATICLLGIILGILLASLYNFKKESADGRLLIWKISLNIIKDNPITGVGIDGFKANYMNYQANYFSRKSNLEDEMVAGDINYAFNDLVQIAVEHGILGLILFFLVIAAVITSAGKYICFSNIQFFNREKYGNQELFTVWHRKVPVINIIVLAGLLNIFVFSLFSYPMQILPIKLNCIFFLAVLASSIPSKKYYLKSLSTILSKNKYSIIFRSIVISSAVCFVMYLGFTHILKLRKSYVNWRSAYQIYQMREYGACIHYYEAAYPTLRNNGVFLTNYGKALSMAGQHLKATKVLEQAVSKYPNIVANNALGDSYKETLKNKLAEQAYLRAWNMNPSRFYSKYLLAKLYAESGQKQKAIDVAKELINKSVKVQSVAITEIQSYMHKIIENGN